MKDYTMFNFNFLFNDHFAKVSNQAKLYYVALNFYAINGFVPNPLQVLDSLGYDKGVFNELVANEELLTLPDRAEVFIASYFVHNPGIKCYSWRATPYAVYWDNKLFVKKNGIATFKPQPDEIDTNDIPPEFKGAIDDITNPSDDDDVLPFEK